MNIDRKNKYKKNNINKESNKIDINFDIASLNLMASYVISNNRNIKRSHLINMRNLFNSINMDMYSNDVEKTKRINFIKKGLIGRLDNGIRNSSLLIKFINGGITEDNMIDLENFTELSTEELTWINETISESLKYSFIYNDINKMVDICTRFQAEDFRNRGEIVEEFEQFTKNINTKFRRSKPESNIDSVFSLKNNFEETVRDIHERIVNPSKRLYTGMQGFNELLGGAFESTRVYMLLGLTGGGKSLTLLDLAYQMKKYNSHYVAKDPTKTPLILYITQENSIDESVERLFSIATERDSISNYSADEAIDLLKNEGGLSLSDESPIDLMIKFIPDKSIDTADLYALVEDLEDEGYEIIAIIQDHIKKMRSAYRHSEIRLELGSIVNEFKVLASLKDLVFITNSHLNRDAASRIDEASKSNKSDLIKLLGRANIGESMLMLDNLDGAFMIAQEYDTNGDKYLGIQRIKKRFKASERSTIFQPYTNPNSITLVEDVGLKVPVFKETLKNLPTEANLYNNGAPINNSLYQNNIKRIDDLIENNSNDALNGLYGDGNSILDDVNIFNASRYTSTPLIPREEQVGYDRIESPFRRIN